MNKLLLNYYYDTRSYIYAQRMKNITHTLVYVSSTVAYAGYTLAYGEAWRDRNILSMLKNCVRIRTYGLYDKLTLGAR